MTQTGTQFSQSAAMQFQTDLLMLEEYTTAYLDSSRQLDCAKKLNKEEKIFEVARILSGNEKSDIALKHAKELIEEGLG